MNQSAILLFRQKIHGGVVGQNSIVAAVGGGRAGGGGRVGGGGRWYGRTHMGGCSNDGSELQCCHGIIRCTLLYMAVVLRRLEGG